jgi:3-dehydro-L-gulonate 2-dehydrogenase
LSQIFITIDPASPGSSGMAHQTLDNIIANLHASRTSGRPVRYPGEQVLKTREENLARGIPVNVAIWKQLHENVG